MEGDELYELYRAAYGVARQYTDLSTSEMLAWKRTASLVITENEHEEELENTREFAYFHGIEDGKAAAAEEAIEKAKAAIDLKGLQDDKRP
jgi:hypothetical protein